MSKFKGHKYEFTPGYNGHGSHRWSLRGPVGGVHFTANFSLNKTDPACGLEFHQTRSSGLCGDEAPHHLNCWLTGEPCWHDGTSLYASETLWPQIQHSLEDGRHDEVFRILEYEYRTHFEREAAR